MNFENKRDFYKWMNRELTARMSSLTTALLGNPESKTSTQWRYGKKLNLLVHVGEGDRKGWYFDFETKASGDALELVKRQTGLSGRDLTDWVKNFIGYEETGNKPFRKHSWTPIVPVPAEAGEPDIAGNKYLNGMLEDGGKETHRHAYRDEDGRLKGYVIRIERVDKDKSKVIKFTPPLAYCENEKGFRVWKWQGFETENKTPYGIEKLKQNSTKPILVVEGEKAADAAQKLLPEYHVLTWQGGAGNVGNTNWRCLVGKDVAIWPDYDYDQGGQRAAQKLQKTIGKLNKESRAEGRVGIVDLPPMETGATPLLPDKWDLADKLPEGWTLDTVRQMVKDAIPLKEMAKELPLNEQKG